ncbi:MAG: RNase P modulator RnpM [Terriglobia bacterium]
MVRKVPLRTCVGCRQTKGKNSLIRLVRGADDHVTVDRSQKKSGRGAYLCPELACFREAVRRRAFEPALKTKLLTEDLDRIEDFFLKSLQR